MIHVDVHKSRNPAAPLDYVVETSVDGGPWALQYLLGFTVGDTDGDVRRRAEECARTFAAGCRFMGGEVKLTSGGYAL